MYYRTVLLAMAIVVGFSVKVQAQDSWSAHIVAMNYDFGKAPNLSMAAAKMLKPKCTWSIGLTRKFRK